MRRRLFLVSGAVLGASLLLLGPDVPAQSQRAVEETLNQRIARTSKLPEENVERLFKALGPAIREELKRGKEVSLPGLGTFRVVRIAEHRDLRDGRPVVIPATNTVEFLPEGTLDVAANSETAKPAETVPSFRYIVVPGQTPGQKTSGTRAPPTRTK
jgi:nucleoid DNA-binding protein